MRLMMAAAIVALSAGAALAHPKEQHAGSTPAAAVSPAARPAASVVDGFHAALARGDQKSALDYLADEALIFESGAVERSKAEYASHHLAADAAFSQAVPAKISRRAGQAAGNLAWVASEGRATGTYKGKAIDSVTTESMVLRRSGAGWKIVHIHWSSAAVGK
jgi:ketosteroid isomerase-like protein